MDQRRELRRLFLQNRLKTDPIELSPLLHLHKKPSTRPLLKSAHLMRPFQGRSLSGRFPADFFSAQKKKRKEPNPELCKDLSQQNLSKIEVDSLCCPTMNLDKLVSTYQTPTFQTQCADTRSENPIPQQRKENDPTISKKENINRTSSVNTILSAVEVPSRAGFRVRKLL